MEIVNLIKNDQPSLTAKVLPTLGCCIRFYSKKEKKIIEISTFVLNNLKLTKQKLLWYE